jgi:hypothetical protein
MPDNMDNNLYSRESLKLLFKDGKRPTENSFAQLIDSSLNRLDDGISKNQDNGLMLAPDGINADKLISFYESISNALPEWAILLNSNEPQGLAISETVSDEEAATRLFFEKGGNIGVGTTAPETSLHVDGILGTNSRVGTFLISTAPADGQWHNIVTNLDGCVSFEISAQVGKQHTGKYALLQANAVSTFGKSRIRCTQAHYGFWWNKIALRFSGDTHSYSLQVKTRSDYGSSQEIKFHLTKLWDNEIMSLFK